MPSTRRVFGRLERSLLEVLWAREEWMTVRQVHESLTGRQSDLAYTTVMTVLGRMAEKGLVERERQGRAFRYRAYAGRAEMTADLMRETLDRVAAGERADALVAFVGSASESELAALREALAGLPSSG